MAVPLDRAISVELRAMATACAARDEIVAAWHALILLTLSRLFALLERMFADWKAGLLPAAAPHRAHIRVDDRVRSVAQAPRHRSANQSPRHPASLPTAPQQARAPANSVARPESGRHGPAAAHARATPRPTQASCPPASAWNLTPRWACFSKPPKGRAPSHALIVPLS